jgi:hypothetical protein
MFEYYIYNVEQKKIDKIYCRTLLKIKNQAELLLV